MSAVMQKMLDAHLILRTYTHYAGMWVKVSSKVWAEGEIFLGKVLSVVNNQTQVWCLKLPFGILEPQEFEWEEDAVF